MPARVFVLVLGCWLSGTAGAEIYRCDGAEVPTFQDFPCAGTGSAIQLEVSYPSADDVARQQARVAALRAALPPPKPEPAAPAKPQTSAPASAPPPAPVAMETRRYPKVVVRSPRHPNSDRVSTRKCPLGLTRCSKVGPRVFRRPKANPGLPFPAANRP